MLATLAGWLAALQVPAPPEPAVEWTAPPECPARAEVIAAIDRRLGRPLAPDEAVVAGRVSRDGRRGFTLRLRLTTGERGETRELSDRSCAALADAVAVLVAAAVEPGGAAAIVPEPAAPAPEPAPEPVAPASAPETAAGPEDAPLASPPDEPPQPPAAPLAPDNVPSGRSKRTGGFVRVHGGPALGAVPRISGAVGLAGGLLWRRWRLELQGAFVAPRTSTGGLTPVRAWLLAWSVHGCSRMGARALEVPLCLGLEGGLMRGAAPQWPSGQPASQGWLAGAATAGLAWHAGARWSLWASLQLLVAPVWPSFELRDPGRPAAEAEELWTPPLASGRLALGVEFRFGDPW